MPGKLIGPGHNSVVLGPDGKTHFMVYHSWNEEKTQRQMCLDPIVWTAAGPRALNPSRGRKQVVLPLTTTESGAPAGVPRQLPAPTQG
jgi:arabinan endo-1,5-alpha-L-arabinosidase